MRAEPGSYIHLEAGRHHLTNSITIRKSLFIFGAGMDLVSVHAPQLTAFRIDAINDDPLLPSPTTSLESLKTESAKTPKEKQEMREKRDPVRVALADLTLQIDGPAGPKWWEKAQQTMMDKALETAKGFQSRYSDALLRGPMKLGDIGDTLARLGRANRRRDEDRVERMEEIEMLKSPLEAMATGGVVIKEPPTGGDGGTGGGGDGDGKAAAPPSPPPPPAAAAAAAAAAVGGKRKGWATMKAHPKARNLTTKVSA